MLCAVFLFGMLALIKTERKSSVSENRTLAKFEHFTVKSFLNGSFQSNFENALSDQFPKNETIKNSYGVVINNMPDFGISRLVCSNRYLSVPGSSQQSRVIYDCGDYILYRPSGLSREQKDVFGDNIKKYNHVNELANVYYYFVNDSSSYDFSKDKLTIDYVRMLENGLKGNYHLSAFEFDGYEDYTKYFYKTDHHWNYYGSYRGYLEICEMLGVGDPLAPSNSYTSKELSYGSHARTLRSYNFDEFFTVYAFDFPDHGTKINGVSGDYGHYEDFFQHKYNYTKNMNFYAYVYGGNNGEVVFDFYQPERKNLLILANSFSNPINILLAQHFNKTYVVDLRYYKEEVGRDFSISDYIREYEIDDVLFIMTAGFVVNDSSNLGLES